VRYRRRISRRPTRFRRENSARCWGRGLSSRGALVPSCSSLSPTPERHYYVLSTRSVLSGCSSFSLSAPPPSLSFVDRCGAIPAKEVGH